MERSEYTRNEIPGEKIIQLKIMLIRASNKGEYEDAEAIQRSKIGIKYTPISR